MFLGCGGLSALQAVGAVALDLGGCPLDLGAAALKLGESLVALCEPVAGRLLMSQSRLLMTRRRLPVPLALDHQEERSQPCVPRTRPGL